MVNGSKNLDLMLEVKDHILKNQDLGMRGKKRKKHPKALKTKFLFVSIPLRKVILLRNAFLEEKQRNGN